MRQGWMVPIILSSRWERGSKMEGRGGTQTGEQKERTLPAALSRRVQLGKWVSRDHGHSSSVLCHTNVDAYDR